MDEVVLMQQGSVLKGRYEVGGLIGRGGMALVYRARDLQLDREVAVKVIDARPMDVAEADRKAGEARVLAKLNHHSLVTLHDAGVDASSPDGARVFLVMELLEGLDLQQWMARGPISSRHVAQVGYDVAEGLEYIHAHGVVHCDVKPANVLIAPYSNSSRARAKLTDFGIATAADVVPASTVGTTLGTAAYMSPEQVRGQLAGPAADVYALGLLLLECFTREYAFPGTVRESLLARLHRDPVIPDWLSDEWRALLRAMTATDPADRPSGQDLVDALRRVVISETGRHRTAPARLGAAHEASRLEAVRRYRILDTPPDPAFDRITTLTARVMDVPVALVSVVDEDRIWLKSHHGIEVDQIDREPGLCSSAILHDEPWIVEDARTDPRAAPNSLVSGGFGLQFYVGVPLRTPDGYNLGTLSILDYQPRTISEKDLATLKDLAALVTNELELRAESSRYVVGATNRPA